MELLDREVVTSYALVIDGNPTSRSVMLQQLRDFGFAGVKWAGRIVDARAMLENRHFDVVICDQHFDSIESGQDLLEELRREHMLPYSTVFFMVTGDASYHKVAEAAEAALDSYLIKPFSSNTLFERLKEARQRKRELKDIYEALDSHQFEEAARLCLNRFVERRRYWLYAARIGTEILLRLKRHVEAKLLLDAVVAARAVPWARLGVARVQLAEGEVVLARRTLEALLSDEPQFTDSYDVMGKVQMEQGQIQEALATYRTAASMTPGCILRLQHCGTLSFYAGDSANAAQALDRTWLMGSRSRLFDVLSMMLLAFLRFDARDGKGLAVACDVLHRFSTNHSQSVRLRRMARIGDILTHLLEDRPQQALEMAAAAGTELLRPDFDMESATNMLSLWSRLAAFGISETLFREQVQQVARRFCASKASTEVLASAARLHPDSVACIRQAHAAVMQMAEAAMNHAVQGHPRAAVETLLHHGRETCNAKLIEMAGLVARRHQDRIPDVQRLLGSVDELTHRYCAPTTHIAGVRRSNRSAGGLVLRR